MASWRGVWFSAASALALLALIASPAFADVSSGQLHATVQGDPWHLTIADGSGHSVLSENRGLGDGPTGTLGFRTAAGWFHATRVLDSRGVTGSGTATLATNDPAGAGRGPARARRARG